MHWTAVGLSLLIALTGGRAFAKEAAPLLFGGERRVVAVGIGLSEETADAPVSLFGHLFAFVATLGEDGARWPLRLEQGINVAVASDGPLDAAAYRRVPLQRLLHEASSKERRGVWLVEIELSEDELAKLEAELEKRMASSVSYDLLRRNCAFYILEWLAAVRPSLRTELTWRPVWTPRQAMDAIRRHFRVRTSLHIPASSDWGVATGAAKPATPLQVIQTEEGVSIAPSLAVHDGRTWGGIVASLGQRGHGTLPLGTASSTRLTIMEVAAYAHEGELLARVRLLELETLREILGESPRLSQRVELGWYNLPRADGLKDWAGQVEMGCSTLLAGNAWLSAMAGLSLSEGTRGTVRPLGSLRMTLPTENFSVSAGFTSTGASSEGLEFLASLRLAAGCELSLQHTDSNLEPAWTSLGVQFRF